MSVSKAKTMAVAVAVAMGMLASEGSLFATAAKADPSRHRGYGFMRADAPRNFDHRRYPEPRPQSFRSRDQHRDRAGDVVAATVLGIGALIVGSAIADAAGRNRDQRYERDDD